MKKLTAKEKNQMISRIQKWIETNKVRCVESIYQSDHVVENLGELAEICCETIGYFDDEDGK